MKKIKINKFTIILGTTLLVGAVAISISVPLILKKKNDKYNFKSINGQAAYLIMESIEMDPVGVASVSYDKDSKVAKLSFLSYYSAVESIKDKVMPVAQIYANRHIILPTSNSFGPPSNTILDDPSNVNVPTVNLVITIDIKNKKLINVESNSQVSLEHLKDYLSKKIQKNAYKLEKAYIQLEK